MKPFHFQHRVVLLEFVSRLSVLWGTKGDLRGGGLMEWCSMEAPGNDTNIPGVLSVHQVLF